MHPEQRYRLMESAIDVMQVVILDILQEEISTDQARVGTWPEYIAAQAGVRGKIHDTNFIRFLAEDMARQGVLQNVGEDNNHRWRLRVPGPQPG